MWSRKFLFIVHIYCACRYEISTGRWYILVYLSTKIEVGSSGKNHCKSFRADKSLFFIRRQNPNQGHRVVERTLTIC